MTQTKCGADGRHWQSWHLRFPRYEYRLARMALHVQTEQFARDVDTLTLCPALKWPWAGQVANVRVHAV
jgi:hypothetical protein